MACVCAICLSAQAQLLNWFKTQINTFLNMKGIKEYGNSAVKSSWSKSQDPGDCWSGRRWIPLTPNSYVLTSLYSQWIVLLYLHYSRDVNQFLANDNFLCWHFDVLQYILIPDYSHVEMWLALLFQLILVFYASPEFVQIIISQLSVKTYF